MRLRLISWNVAGRTGSKLRAQMGVLNGRDADVVALQEVTLATVDHWIEHNRDLYPRFLESHEPSGRRYFNLVLSRWPIRNLHRPALPCPERVISCSVRTPSGAVQLHNIHIPDGSSYAWKKIETFEALYHRLSGKARIPRIVCGDFNSPAAESIDGTVTPFGEGRPPRWGDAELSVITGLAELGVPDVFRTLHGYEPRDVSWIPRRGDPPTGRRFDHIFASPSLNPVDCRYHHGWREAGYSDHSAIEATFEPASV